MNGWIYMYIYTHIYIWPCPRMHVWNGARFHTYETRVVFIRMKRLPVEGMKRWRVQRYETALACRGYETVARSEARNNLGLPAWPAGPAYVGLSTAFPGLHTRWAPNATQHKKRGKWGMKRNVFWGYETWGMKRNVFGGYETEKIFIRMKRGAGVWNASVFKRTHPYIYIHILCT